MPRLLRLIAPLVLVLVLVGASLGGAANASLPPEAADSGHAHAGHGPDGLALDRRVRTPGATYSVDNHAAWASCEYDGVARSTDTTDLSAYATTATGYLPQVHAVYVHPANSASRFLSFAAMFQADARQSSALLQTLGRDVRWDLRETTTTPPVGFCGAATMLDITVFRSQYSAKQLSTSRQFSLVANELAASGKFSAPDKKYVVWLDAGSRYCGQGSLWQDINRSATNKSEVNRTTGIVYRPYANDPATGGFCRGRTLLHELGHNMGAVQNVAPNAFDGAHCDDDNNDTMCYRDQAADQITSPTPQFDFGKNDYWDLGASQVSASNPDGLPTTSAEKLGWWALNLSKYVCPLATTGTSADCARANSNPGY